MAVQTRVHTPQRIDHLLYRGRPDVLEAWHGPEDTAEFDQKDVFFPARRSVSIQGIGKRGATTEHAWTEQTMKRVAAGLLKIAVDFGLLRGSVVKEFASFHLPERSFVYLLHALRDEKLSPSKFVGSPDWRMFLMRPGDVEHELLRLHQFRKLEYQVAGSLVQLSLPCTSSREYAERMVA